MIIMIIAPHADDEVLGCGGVINKFSKEGHRVIVLVATNAHVGAPELYNRETIENVRNEALESHKILGVSETLFLELPAPRLDVYPIYQIADKFSEIISNHKPQILFLPHKGDSHKDHLAVFNAAMVAARPINACTVKKILSYETLSETEWAVPSADESFVPNVYISIEENLDTKIEAIKKYKSQLRKFPHPRSVETIRSLAQFRGSTVGYRAAEAFILIREIQGTQN